MLSAALVKLQCSFSAAFVQLYCVFSAALVQLHCTFSAALVHFLCISSALQYSPSALISDVAVPVVTVGYYTALVWYNLQSYSGYSELHY